MFQSPDGDLIDCVLAHQQPAFDHPQLKGQKPLVNLALLLVNFEFFWVLRSVIMELNLVKFKVFEIDDLFDIEFAGSTREA